MWTDPQSGRGEFDPRNTYVTSVELTLSGADPGILERGGGAR